MDFTSAKQSVKNELENYLAGKGINLKKPFRCLNPEHEDVNPSMSYDKRRSRAHCFSCGADYDMFDVIGIDFGLSSQKDAFNKAFELFGIEIPRRAANKPDKPRISKQDSSLPDEKIDYTDYFSEVQKHIADTDYPRLRGLSAQTIARFGLGFDKCFNKGTGSAVWKALIIPTGKNSFIARNTDPNADKRDRIRKQGGSPLYNLKAAMEGDKPIFIVEGEIDALSVIEAGGNALALGSTANYAHVLRYIKQSCVPSQPILICLDNDTSGRDTSVKLLNGLKTLGARSYVVDIASGFKDPNEALVSDREAFVKSVAKAADIELAMREAACEEYKKTSVHFYLQEFVNGIVDSVNVPCISTGFDKLDFALDGGFYEGLYIVGAISSLGKTTLMTQIADQIAAGGCDVLIFSLEMSKMEIIAKSVSRITLMECLQNNIPTSRAKTMRGIIAGKRYESYSADEIGIIKRGITEYRHYSSHIYIIEAMGDLGVLHIRDMVRRHVELTGNSPVVLIDYLQILAPINERGTDKQNMDRAVLELKRISRDYKLPVIAISSFNRQNYREAVNMEAFKESGAIEYSSDVLIGLQLKGAGGKDFDANAEKIKNPREIELKILKNRNGMTGRCVGFLYYPMFNFFKEI